MLNSAVPTPPVNASATAAIPRDIWVIACFKGLLSPSSSSNATRGFHSSLWVFCLGSRGGASDSNTEAIGAKKKGSCKSSAAG